ncbi:hypothetical protein WA1_48985 [Scytonema hofmannii PCC 7110]|uniref:Uncharacterized protein n=1 Tax=Scytonema hofmannii PCC 7110 TaxID=128403 RepID=A0A139WU44_9CYAN|nr:hypothetical protein [Scytonema hofmannii]KYC35956.1 hypothetical protein WA1_48985 [Scytonema hofmannii PCC 7110]
MNYPSPRYVNTVWINLCFYSLKLKLIRILAEELDTKEDISPLEPDKTYHLPLDNREETLHYILTVIFSHTTL